MRKRCESFIRSEKDEGWQLVKTQYDDGGFSGGTIERPALQRLLEDIRQKLIDVVVVHKVDRLDLCPTSPRWLKYSTATAFRSWPSPKQFNTTSMGRLTLETDGGSREKLRGAKRSNFCDEIEWEVDS
jgi:site-specific DNA recombinase